MGKSKLLMVDLNEDQTTHVAQVLANKVARRILDALADKDATESELSSNFSVPLSTIHYNMQQLVKSGLVISENYHYSEKGKEVLHYKLANQYIIIAPKKVHGLKRKLSSLLPVAMLSLIGSSLVYFYNKFRFSGTLPGSTQIMSQSADIPEIAAGEGMRTSAEPLVQEAVVDDTGLGTSVPGADGDASLAYDAYDTIPADSLQAEGLPVDTFPADALSMDAVPIDAIPMPYLQYALWFLAGCAFVIVLIMIIETIQARRKSP